MRGSRVSTWSVGLGARDWGLGRVSGIREHIPSPEVPSRRRRRIRPRRGSYPRDDMVADADSLFLAPGRRVPLSLPDRRARRGSRADAGSVSPRRPRADSGGGRGGAARMGVQDRQESRAQSCAGRLAARHRRRARRDSGAGDAGARRHVARRAGSAAGVGPRRLPHARGRRPELRRDRRGLRADLRRRAIQTPSGTAAAPGRARSGGLESADGGSEAI